MVNASIDIWDVSDKVFPRAPRRSATVGSVANAKNNITWWTREGSDIAIPWILDSEPGGSSPLGPSGSATADAGTEDFPRAPRRSTVFPRAPRQASDQTVFQSWDGFKSGRTVGALALMALAGVGVYLAAR